MKTAYLIGGYARSGKSTMMSLIKQMGGNTFSTSKTLADHTKMLFPDLIGLVNCTTDSAKAMAWDINLIELDAAWVQSVLADYGYSPAPRECELIVADFYARLGSKLALTLREILIAVAESHRIIFPHIYAAITLDKIGTLDTIYLETIGGKELDGIVEELRDQRYRIVGVNVRAKTESASVDIRELIRRNQCDKLLTYQNAMADKSQTLSWINANIIK